MGLFVAINQYLTDKLLTQLAEASALPIAAARAFAAAAVPVLVQQLARPTDADELNARWDMCRQLYLSQLLTEPEELLRTDLGWPDRRRYLTQKMLGTNQVAALVEPAAQPAQAATLLGYLTVLTLALVGKAASGENLSPQALGNWLAGQRPPAPTLAPAPLGALVGAPVAKAGPPVAATAGKTKLTTLSAVGGLAVAGLAGGYFWLSTPAEGAPPAARPVAVVVRAAPASPPVAAAPVAAPPVASPPVVAVAPAAETPPPVAAHPKLAAPMAAPAAGLRDTVGNAAMARQVGGKFSVSAGRYPKGEGQPLIIKLVNRATLTVGINSTESLLYKRLAHPSLPRPADIAVDRLSFDLGQARLGAGWDAPADIAVDRLSFDLGQARLGAEGAQQLGSIASLLKTFPKARLVVVGHANNHEAQAMRLGLQRATLAVEELVKQGIPADRLQAQGMLSTELPSDNDSAEKQAMLQGITLKMSRL